MIAPVLSIGNIYSDIEIHAENQLKCFQFSGYLKEFTFVVK